MNFGLEKDKIKQAELLARFVHCNQLRRDGEEYIEHPQRMVTEYIRSIPGNLYYNVPGVYKELKLSLEQVNIVCAIWLHDCIEDAENSYAVAAMIGCHFSNKTRELVRILTHRKWQSYNEYIERVAQNPQALQIKWEDLRDNTSHPIPNKQWLKYRNALIHLIGLNKLIVIPTILVERLEIGDIP